MSVCLSVTHSIIVLRATYKCSTDGRMEIANNNSSYQFNAMMNECMNEGGTD